MPPSARIHRFRGAAAVTLRASEMEATFLPELGMTGASLLVRGHELVALARGVRAIGAGHTAGLPLLHPWANRLAIRRFDVAGTPVDLEGLPIHTDPSGLPMHGTVLGHAGWEVVALDAGPGAAVLTARLAYATPELLAAFPFPHTVEISVSLDGETLTVATTVRPTGAVAVPVSFGWHPYLRVPGRRAGWRLRLPARERHAVDAHLIPTGHAVAQPAEDEPIGGRTFDDGYVLGGDRCLALTGRGLRLEMELDAGYPVAQVYVPRNSAFACLEPMTAPTNALVTGACPIVEPGDSFVAVFTLRPTLGA